MTAGEALRLRLDAKAASIEELRLTPQAAPRPAAGEGEAVVEVKGAAINPSDVKAALGLMPHAVWPRTPGRDYAGVVVDGPREWIGREVWGSGGDLGIRRDGTHARYLTLPAAALVEKPTRLSLLEAGAIGVPFVTAYEGLRRAGLPRAGEAVLVCGANGKVGQAVVQLAARAGAVVIALVREPGAFDGYAARPVHEVAASDARAGERIRELTAGSGVGLVFNTVGSPYFEIANQAMATGAVQVFIATLERGVPFDIFRFYRGQHTYVGIDSLALDATRGAAILEKLRPGFEDGSLRPFPVDERAVYAIGDALAGYRAVLAGSRGRVMLKP